MRVVIAVCMRASAAARGAALALGLFTISWLLAGIGDLSFISRARGQPAALTGSQSDALNNYNNAVHDFKSLLSQRRAQINSKEPLPSLPGQALYLARNGMISA